MNQEAIFKVLIVGLFSLIFSNCGQLSSLQTAKPIGKDKAIIGGAVYGYGVDGNYVQGGDIGSGFVPHVEFLGRYGVGERFDIGLKLSSSINVLLDGKFQFVGNQESKFAAAIGAGFEWQGTDVNEVLVYRAHLPLYLSVHPNSKTAIYATPRYVFQSVSDDSNSYFLGGSLGFSYLLAPRLTGVIEGSFYNPYTQNVNNDRTIVYQFGLGVAYWLKN